MIKISITEFHLSKTNFKKPKVSEGAEAIAILIVRLILLEPGTIQSHPTMGVGLISKYRNRLDSEEGIVNTFLSDLKFQIDSFLPQARAVELSGVFTNKQLYVRMRINNKLYTAAFEDKDSTMEWISLTELKEDDYE